MKLKPLLGLLATLAIACAAVMIGRALWFNYMEKPWTRDGRVRANIVNVAAEVAGVITRVPITDNQLVKKGDVLLEIDPKHYAILLEQAEALAASRRATMEMRNLNAKRRAAMDDDVVSRESLDDARNTAAAAQAAYRESLAAVAAARLNVERTRVLAPVDGYVTNLDVHEGDYSQVGVAQVAVVDKNSFWVYGYFEETKLPRISIGDEAEMQLMSGERMSGHVVSIARAIYDRDNPQSQQLIADVNPTFNWVRLAQRVPVRIHIDFIPTGMLLSAGTTTTVVVKPKTSLTDQAQ